MVIKPSGTAYCGAVVIALATSALGAFCIYIAAMKQYDFLLYYGLPIFIFILFYTSRNICLWCKTVELCPEGYRVSFCGVQQLYRWKNVKIKRIEDCRQVLGRRNIALYPECLFISVHEMQRPKWCNPVEFCVFTHPFSNVYACFKPEKTGVWELLGTAECIVIDKQELINTLQSFGIELD